MLWFEKLLEELFLDIMVLGGILGACFLNSMVLEMSRKSNINLDFYSKFYSLEFHVPCCVMNEFL